MLQNKFKILSPLINPDIISVLQSITKLGKNITLFADGTHLLCSRKCSQQM